MIIEFLSFIAQPAARDMQSSSIGEVKAKH